MDKFNTEPEVIAAGIADLHSKLEALAQERNLPNCYMFESQAARRCLTDLGEARALLNGGGKNSDGYYLQRARDRLAGAKYEFARI